MFYFIHCARPGATWKAVPCLKSMQQAQQHSQGLRCKDFNSSSLVLHTSVSAPLRNSQCWSSSGNRYATSSYRQVQCSHTTMQALPKIQSSTCVPQSQPYPFKHSDTRQVLLSANRAGRNTSQLLHRYSQLVGNWDTRIIFWKHC